MPRTKGRRSSRAGKPVILQDHTGLEQDITTTIIGEFVTPLEVRIEQLEADVAAIGRNTVQTATLELNGRRGGTTYLEPAGGFTEDAVGRPVLINQGPSGDADEGRIVSFTAEVLNAKSMRVRYFCAERGTRSVEVVYLIG